MTNLADYNQNYISESVGYSGDYSVNTRTGRVDFIKSISKFGGSLLPAEIYFVYNPFFETEEGATGFPKGWKLNVHQKIIKADEDYKYVDALGHYHIFKKMDNYLYYDSAHTGLLLKVEDGVVKITDDRNYTLYFDDGGRLKKLEERKGVSAASIDLTYQSGRVTVIKDGMGRQIVVSYGENSVVITLPDHSGVKIEDKNGTTLITDKDGGLHSYTFTNKGGKDLLETVIAAGGEEIQFVYDSKGKAISITEIINGAKYKEWQLAYNTYYTIIKHINNRSLNSEVSYRTMDAFALNGEYISSSEVSTDDEVVMSLFKSKDEYSEYMLNLAATNYVYGKIGDKTTYTFSNTGGRKTVEGEFSSDISVGDGKRCAISMQLLNYELADMGKKINVRVERKSEPGVSLLEQPFEITIGGPFVENEAAALTVSGNLSDIKFIIETEELLSRVVISNIRIGVMNRNGYALCTDGAAGGAVFQEKVGNITKSWRKIYDCCLNGVNDCERMTRRDWLFSKDNAARAEGNRFIIWYNDLGGAILSNGEQIVSVNGQNRLFSAINCAVVSFDRALTTFEYTLYDKDGYFSKTVNNYVRNGTNKLCVAYSDIYGRTIKTVDSNNTSVTYEYDAYGRKISNTTEWVGGSAVQSITYSAVQNGQYTHTITRYGRTAVYTYDYASGKIISVRDENGNTLEYDYDAMERLNLLKGAAGGNINKNELIYSGSNISEIKHPGTQYNIAYDSKKHISAFRIGSDNFFTTENFIYGAHGEFLTYNYPESNVTLYADKYGRTVKEVWSDGGQRCYCYGAESENMSGVTAGNFENRSTYSAAKLRKVIDGTDYVVYNYVDGDFVGKEYGDGKSYTVRYDAYGRVNSEEVKYSTSGYQNTFYLYNDGDAANGDRVGLAFLSDGTNTSVASFIYDECGRLKNQIKGTLHGSTLNEVENVQYRYGLADPTVVSQVVYGNGETCNYVYDSCGNITQITGKENVKYTYDALNRLVREDNADIGNSYEYNYDAGGNITAKKVYGYTTGMLGAPIKTYSYVYGDDNWKDKLTSWNGQSITYDDIGKPLDYKGCTLAWDERNRLIRTLNSKAYTEYTYGKDGKPVKSVSLISGGYIGTSEITYAEGRLYKKTTRVTTVSGSLLSESETEFLYCGEEVIGLKYNGGMYYYRKNLQGDIIAIVDEEGNEVGRYAYDAWGNCLASGSGVISANPFRYRGYYWDGEAGLYFLNTRWYDPETGRFISPDSISYLDPESINGLNLYAYCLNNPVMYTDPYGTTAWWEWLLGGLIVVGLAVGSIVTGGAVAAVLAGAAIGGAISYGTQAVSGELNWGQFALDIGVGALTGAIGASGLSRGVATALSGLIGSGSSIASDLINGNSVNWGKAAVSGLIGVVAGYAGGAGVKNVRGLASSGKFFGASSNMPGIAAFLLKTSKIYLLTAQYKLFLGTMKYYTMGTIANNIVNIFM